DMGLCSSKKALPSYDPITSRDAGSKTDGHQASSSSGTGHKNRDRCDTATSQASDDETGSGTSEGSKGSKTARWCDVSTEFSSRANAFIVDTWGHIRDFYQLDKQRLGQGAFGYVCKGISLETGATRAIKKLSKARAKDLTDRFKMEIDIMKMTDHPNIVKLMETFEDPHHFFL
ncbi:unnamed protein product, partial [Polarella glacialis]